MPVKKGACMTDLNRIEQEALKEYAKEELKSLKILTDEELQALDDKGEIVQYYGNFLIRMSSQQKQRA